MSPSSKKHKSLWRRLRRSTRAVRYAFVIPLLESVRLLAGVLPHAWVLALGRALGRLAWIFGPRHRHLAVTQLLRTGVATDKPEARQLARRVFANLGMNALEWLHSLRWRPEDLRAHFRVDGLDLLESVFGERRGAIVVSAHMGNWELVLSAWHAMTGRSVMAVMTPQRDPVINQWLVNSRSVEGCQLVSNESSAIGILRHLKRGGQLALVSDQDTRRTRGIFVDFFGRPAFTPVGPAHLAYRTGAPLVPVTVMRDPSNPARHIITIDEPIRPNSRAEEGQELQRLTQAFTAVLEARIRQNPTEWAWVHDRWRHRPDQKIKMRGATRR